MQVDLLERVERCVFRRASVDERVAIKIDESGMGGRRVREEIQ